MSKNSEFFPVEWESKIRKVKEELEQIYEYKAILKEDGLVPDEQDKQRESRLFLQLRQLERKKKGEWVPDELYRGPGREPAAAPRAEKPAPSS